MLGLGEGRGRPGEAIGIAREIAPATDRRCLIAARHRPVRRDRVHGRADSRVPGRDAPPGRAGRSRGATGQARGGARPAGAVDPGATTAAAPRPTRATRVASGGRGVGEGRDHDRRPVHPLRRAARRRLRGRRHRLRRSDWRARVRRPDVAELPRAGRRSGARIVHSCGFDSIPYDLGVQFTVEHLPEDVPISLEGFMRTKASFSGGTYQSAIEILAGCGPARSWLESGVPARAIPPAGGLKGDGEAPPGRVRRRLGRPVPDVDPATVLRSARALERYETDFSYSHYLVAGPLPMLLGLGAAAGVVAALAQIPRPAIKLMEAEERGGRSVRGRAGLSRGSASGSPPTPGTGTARTCVRGERPRSRLHRHRRCSPSPRCVLRTTIFPRAAS